MKKLENFHLLVMLIALIAVGQMTQTVYVPVITDIALDFGEPAGAVQSVMAAYLFTYGASQLIYGPISDKVGRRPVILTGLVIYIIATTAALFSPNLTMLVVASGLQGLGTGVAGVMARTMPRDLYTGISLRYANSLLNMGILVSPLIAPMLGGALAAFFGWRACYAFLLVLGLAVGYNMWHKLPETRPAMKEKPKMWASFRLLLTNRTFVPYLVMLICGLAGVAVFEASSGVLMRDGLGLGSMAVSVLFILPIPAAFFGAWFAGRDSKSFSFLVWCAVICCLSAGVLMWIPGLMGIMNVWTLLIPASVFFFGAGMLFPLATTAAMEPFPYLAGAAGALVGGLQNVGSGAITWISSLMPQGGQSSVGLLMVITGVVMVLCWAPVAHRMQRREPMAS